MKAYRILSAAVAMTSLVVVLAVAQQPPTPSGSPGPGWVQQDGGWLPSGHPAIRDTPLQITRAPENPPLEVLRQTCVDAQPAGASNLDLLQACGHFLGTPIPGCARVNAYEEPDRAQACAAIALAQAEKQPPRDFVLGAVYGRPYGERKILIVGRALGLDGLEIITAQVVQPTMDRGQIVAFANDGGLEAAQWWPTSIGGAR